MKFFQVRSPAYPEGYRQKNNKKDYERNLIAAAYLPADLLNILLGALTEQAGFQKNRPDCTAYKNNLL